MRALLLALALCLLGAGTAYADGTDTVVCPVGFSSLPKTVSQGMSQADILRVRAGGHPCFDRVVVDVNGPIGGVNAAYVDEILGNASGLPIPLAGKAFILLVVRNPAEHPVPIAPVLSLPTLRGLVNAGSFEGVTLFGIGAKSRLPFRLFTVGNSIILDVAHHW